VIISEQDHSAEEKIDETRKVLFAKSQNKSKGGKTAAGNVDTE
jgi:hypothetical protein